MVSVSNVAKSVGTDNMIYVPSIEALDSILHWQLRSACFIVSGVKPASRRNLT